MTLGRRAHLQAALALTAQLVWLLLATPGLDRFKADMLDNDRARGSLVERWGPLGQLGNALLEFNREVRIPVTKLFDPLQRVFMTYQSFSLYLDGPKKPGRVEIRVDGALVYRTNDDEYRWRREQLVYRRMRPFQHDLMLKRSYVRATTLYVARRAEEDFGPVSEVEVSVVRSDWGEPVYRTKRRWLLHPPAWKPEEVDP